MPLPIDTNKNHRHPDEDDQVAEDNDQDGGQKQTIEHSRVSVKIVETAAERNKG